MFDFGRARRIGFWCAVYAGLALLGSPAFGASACVPATGDYPELKTDEDKALMRRLLSQVPAVGDLLAPDELAAYRAALADRRCRDADRLLAPRLQEACPEMAEILEPGHRRPDEAPWSARRSRIVLLMGGYRALALCHDIADLDHLEARLAELGRGGGPIGIAPRDRWQDLPENDDDLTILRDEAFRSAVSMASDDWQPEFMVAAARLLLDYGDRLAGVRDHYPPEAAYYLLRRAEVRHGLSGPEIDELLPRARAGLSADLATEAEDAALDPVHWPDEFLARYLDCPWQRPDYPPTLPKPVFSCKVGQADRR
ncbi:MAG TPA: hypothetical protein PLJ34_00525 [Hyphomicrobiales bacterium]|nr:hypothetical protein [Hyphomicrobiales bacterium]